MKRFSLKSVCALLLCAAILTPAVAAEADGEVEAAKIALTRITWEELGPRIREGGTNSQALKETIGSVEAIDYERMEKQLRDDLNEVAQYQWFMYMSGNTAMANDLQKSYDSLREAFDSVRDGEMQSDNADTIHQLQDAENQIVAAGQALYIQLIGLEQSLADGERGMATLDRSLAEMQLRNRRGQVSDSQVAELEQKRSDTEVQLTSLSSTIATYKRQLQALMGEEPTGVLELAPLPDLIWEISERDYDADLAAAKEASWAVRSAQITLENAEEDWEDAEDEYGSWSKRFEMDIARHTWEAAQLTYKGAIEDFENSFHTLYTSLESYRRAYDHAASTLEYQGEKLKLAQKKYDMGLISRYALMDAEDAFASAQSEADSAWRDLFNAQNQYINAVKTGIV